MVHLTEYRAINKNNPTACCFNSFMGPAFCTAFSRHRRSSLFSHVWAPSNTLYLELIVKINGYQNSVSISFDANSLTQSNHLWLCYMSKSYFTAPECPTHIQASFAVSDHQYMELKVKECGLCLGNDRAAPPPPPPPRAREQSSQSTRPSR